MFSVLVFDNIISEPWQLTTGEIAFLLKLIYWILPQRPWRDQTCFCCQYLSRVREGGKLENLYFYFENSWPCPFSWHEIPQQLAKLQSPWSRFKTCSCENNFSRKTFKLVIYVTKFCSKHIVLKIPISEYCNFYVTLKLTNQRALKCSRWRPSLICIWKWQWVLGCIIYIDKMSQSKFDSIGQFYDVV